MAEFCLECFKEFFGEEMLTEEDVVTEFDLCEGCGEWKPCVVTIRKRNFFKDVIFDWIEKSILKK